MACRMHTPPGATPLLSWQWRRKLDTTRTSKKLNWRNGGVWVPASYRVNGKAQSCSLDWARVCITLQLVDRGCLHLEVKDRSPKKWSVMIGGNKWYPVFGYTSKNKWAQAFVFFHEWKVYVEFKVVYMNSDFPSPRVSICCYFLEVAIS